MFRSYWTIAWRTVTRNRVYTLINVFGLALGICACFVIWVIVRYEFSFDRGHPDANRVYRINSYEQFMKDEPEHLTPAVQTDIPVAVRKEVPGVEVVAPFYPLQHDTAMVVAGGKPAFYPAQSVVAGPEYLSMMGYRWLEGNPSTALVHPFSVVLTESRAQQYFGTGSLNGIIGREIVYQDSLRVHDRTADQGDRYPEGDGRECEGYTGAAGYRFCPAGADRADDRLGGGLVSDEPMVAGLCI